MNHRFHGATNPRPVLGPAAPVASASGFMLCPVGVPQGMMGQLLFWQQAYRLAYEQAQAVVQPSLFERFVAPNMN